MGDKLFAEVSAKILMRGVKPRMTSKAAAIQPQAAAPTADEVRAGLVGRRPDHVCQQCTVQPSHAKSLINLCLHTVLLFRWLLEGWVLVETVSVIFFCSGTSATRPVQSRKCGHIREIVAAAGECVQSGQ